MTELQRLRIQNRVTSLLAEASAFDSVAPSIMEAIGTASEWVWGSLWKPDESDGQLKIQTHWRATDFEASSFWAASESLRFAPDQGLPGLTWIQGKAHWMEDLQGDPRFRRKDAARQAGLRSGFAFPVRFQDRVLRVMVFLSREVRGFDAEFLAMMEALGSQMGQFIERERAEAFLKQSEEKYRALVEESGEGIYLFDLDSGAVLESNPAFRQLLGYSLETVEGLTLSDFIAEDRGSIEADGKRLLETGHLYIGERKYRRKDGALLDVDVTVNRLTLKGGRIGVAVVHDLSARKQVESERDRLAEILEATTDFVGMADPVGQLVYGNRAMRELRGLDSPELGRRIAEAHPPWAARKVLEEGLPTAMAEGVWRGESAFLDQQGREIPISQLILAHRAPSGQVGFFSTIARDISEQKKAERELKDLLKHLEDLRYAVDESTIFAITDAMGVITEVNERFCEVSGYSREELLGKTHRVIKSGRHPKGFFRQMWETILAGGVWRGEVCNRAKDGSQYWVDTTIVPWLNGQGRPERFISLRTIITDRKRVEEALLRREEQLEVLSIAAREINSELDIKTVMRRLVESALRLTGAADGTFGMLVHGRLEFRDYFREGSWIPIDYTFGPGEGVPGHIMETLQPYISNDAEGDPHVIPEIQRTLKFFNLVDIPILGRKGGLLGAVEIHNTHDRRPFGDSDLSLLQGLVAHAAVALENALWVEENRRQEEALRHTQKLESLGILAGGIAHDFNNLLTAIMGNLSLAMLETPATEESSRYLQSIDRAVMRAADLTRQMLAYAGKGLFIVKRLDLNATVEDIARLLEASILKKVHLRFHLRPGLPELEADPAQLEQLVMNLVTNAADAIGDREGTVTLTTDFQEFTESDLRTLLPGLTLAPGPYLTLDVTDTGSGMSAEVIERIFDPFFTTKTTGRGLGLSAMLGILRSHRGGVKVYSEPGRGSTFRLFLPAASGGPLRQDREAEAELWKGHGTVLIADDDDDVRAATRAQIEQLGFQTLEARDGREAMALFHLHREAIDLVFTDFSMPHMDGREVLRAIRALDPGARVILCSGFDEGAAAAGAQDVAPNGFLQKPFRPAALSRLLREALEGPPRPH
ncbi:MAG TPA: PAS domain S-box protein [Geothrix sp.]|nr:PAS domain S-box protein [Geothrix sp.]